MIWLLDIDPCRFLELSWYESTQLLAKLRTTIEKLVPASRLERSLKDTQRLRLQYHEALTRESTLLVDVTSLRVGAVVPLCFRMGTFLGVITELRCFELDENTFYLL